MVETAALLAAWSSDGEKDLFNALLPHVRSASEPQSSATLYDAFHALIGSTTTTTSKLQPLLTPTSASSFIHKLIQALPSSSTADAPDSATANAIDELLIDVLWALDVHLDDIIQDAIALERAKATPQDGESAEDPSDRLTRAKARRATAEADRATLAEVVKLLLRSSVIQLPTCRARLDFGLLVLVGVVPNKAALEKKEVQTKTRLFYRQNKFNLLREQSEGYTKLSVELIASIGPPHNPEDGRPVEQPELIRARAHEVWDKVVSLVGYFDLDPNRVLDIILDVFSYYIITHHSFFLELLRCSPWAGASNAPPEDVSMAEEQESSKYAGLSFDNVLRVARGLAPLDDEAMDVDDQPAKKASVCAQVLGFKFSHYQSNDLRLPRTFCLLAALLIRERFITLDDLLPHFPEDHEMKKERDDFDKDILERISNARSSALALAAPLAADDIPSNKPGDAKKKDDKDAADKTKDKPKEPVPNPRLLLLHALLALGALEPAYQMLSYAPWLSSASPEVAELLLRVAHYSLDPLHESTVNRHERYRASVLGAKMKYSASAGLVPAPAKKPSLTWTAPTPPSTASTEFVFFYPRWTEGIPVCRHHSDVRDVLEPMLRFIGVQVHCDTVFMTKLCRVAKAQICVPNVDKTVTDLWVLICRLYLLPGMSLLNNNTTISAEIWPILRAMDATARWGLYGEWASHMYKAYPEMRVRKVEAEREAKAIMRRLSTKTVTTLNRNVAKLAHCNPCVLFTHMVNQVQAYDNMAEVVVESLKFCALMPFDVLLFTVIETLANPNKDRLKDDGISVSQWLQSLASFTGLLCRRYYQVDCSLILRYVVNRLRDDQVMEIIVLRELIAKMTGMQPPENLSEQQIMALSGGPILRIEAVASETRGVLLEKPLLQTRSTERLMTGLTSQGLGKALLVLTARQRKACVFTSRVQHLKSLSTLFDSVQQIHTLFVECLATSLPSSAYTALLPPFKALCATYDIEPYTAMQIYRPKLHQDILAHVLAEPKESTEEAERRLKAALAAKREPSASAPDAPKASPKEEKPATTDTTDVMDVERSPWLHLLEPLIKEVEEVLGPRVSDVLGAPFYVTFWQLSLYDLSPPGKRYEEESARHKLLLKKTSDAINDPSTKSTRARELRTRKDRINASTDGLVKEYSNIASNRQFTLKRLATEKQHWFPHGKDRMQDLTNQILQHCIIPRALISPMDADFCAHFIRTLHLLATPSFHTLRIYDKILNDGLSALVFSCTETEARNLGRFLRNILQDLKSWSEPNNRFLEETMKGTSSLLPGFQRLWVPTRKTYTPSDVISKTQLVQLLRKWHMKVSVGLMECVDGSEYMQIYNAIVILKELLPVLPRQDVNYAIGPRIHDTVKACIERETREDLKVLAQAYLQHLLKVKDTWEVKKAAPAARTQQGSDSKARSTGGTSVATQAASSPQQRDSAPSVSAAATRQSAQGAAPSSVSPAENKSSAPAKLAFEGVPRPEVVKRVARTGTENSPKPESTPSERRDDRRDEHANDTSTKNGTAPPVARSPAVQSLPTKPDTSARPAQNGVNPVPTQPPSPLHQPPAQGVQRREPPMSPRGYRPAEEHGRVSNQIMPPPNAPSSTTAAQDMRSRAARDDRERNDGRTPTRGLTPTGRPRSASPPSRRQSPSRGSGRNGSQDAASNVPRTDDRYRDTRPSTYTRDGHADLRDSRDRPSANRARDDERTNEERFRDRERHHHEPREREHAGRSVAPVRSDDENRGGDQSRRNSTANALPDDPSGKRRRHTDDEPSDRSSKRSSRHADKDAGSHRERDDRTRGHRREKERGEKDKERDRRESSEKRGHRKEREPREDAERDRESRGTEPSDKTGDKSTRPSEPSAGNGKAAVLPPSGPRAMVTPEAPRGNRAEAPTSSVTRAADSNREPERASSSADLPTQHTPTQPQQGGTPSLRERLGGYQSSAPERNALATSSREDTHGENRGMKRGLADRTSGRDTEAESGTPPHKRPKIQRQRYPVNSNQLEKGG